MSKGHQKRSSAFEPRAAQAASQAMPSIMTRKYKPSMRSLPHAVRHPPGTDDARQAAAAGAGRAARFATAQAAPMTTSSVQ